MAVRLTKTQTIGGREWLRDDVLVGLSATTQQRLLQGGEAVVVADPAGTGPITVVRGVGVPTGKAVVMVKGQKVEGTEYHRGDVLLGLSGALQAKLVQGGDALLVDDPSNTAAATVLIAAAAFDFVVNGGLANSLIDEAGNLWTDESGNAFVME